MNDYLDSFIKPFPLSGLPLEKGKKFMVRPSADLKRSPFAKGRNPIGRGVCKIIIERLNNK